MQLNQKSTDPIFIIKLHTIRSIILIYFPLDKMMNIKEICCILYKMRFVSTTYLTHPDPQVNTSTDRNLELFSYNLRKSVIL